MIEKIIRKAAEHMAGHVAAETFLHVNDDGAILKFCRDLLVRRCLAKGLDPRFVEDASTHKYDLLQVATEHLLRRARYGLAGLSIDLLQNTDPAATRDRIRRRLERALAAWISADHGHIETACNLVLGDTPWQGWPD